MAICATVRVEAAGRVRSYACDSIHDASELAAWLMLSTASAMRNCRVSIYCGMRTVHDVEKIEGIIVKL